MTENYTVSYSEDALNDLREIYTYSADELLVPETATAQVRRIRKENRSSTFTVLLRLFYCFALYASPMPTWSPERASGFYIL